MKGIRYEELIPAATKDTETASQQEKDQNKERIDDSLEIIEMCLFEADDAVGAESEYRKVALIMHWTNDTTDQRRFECFSA